MGPSSLKSCQPGAHNVSILAALCLFNICDLKWGLLLVILLRNMMINDGILMDFGGALFSDTPMCASGSK